MQHHAGRLATRSWSTSAAAASSSSALLARHPPCTCSSGLSGRQRPTLATSATAGRQLRRRSYSSAPLPSPLQHPDASQGSPSTSSRGRKGYTPSLPSSNLTSYGQPLPSTHPHLLQHGELTPGIPASEYEGRRRKLMDGLPDKSVVVLAGGRLQYSSQSIFYKFRQVSDFIYLTGWLEPDAAVILEKAPTTSRGYKMTFFCPSRDPDAELWEGPRNGPNGAVDVFGADNAMDIHLFTSHLKALLTSTNNDGPIYVDLPDSPAGSARAPRNSTRTAKSIFNFLSGAASGARRTSLDLGLSSRKSDYESVVALLSGTGGRTVKSLKESTEKLRIIKSDNEIKLMRKAADISGDAHAKVMRLAQSGMSEHALVTTFEYECAIRGSERPAYLPVCSSGANSRYLHYTAASALLEHNALVLLDAGCEHSSYAADITRVFPVSGTFTEPEKDLYTAVLRTIKECTKLCSEKRRTNLHELHEHSQKTLRAELKQVGVDAPDHVWARIYPHFVGHPLGLDLHDCPTFQRSTRLEAGNVITIEPGVYMPDDSSIPRALRNISIRLEEEILVGKEHPTILSVNAPIEIVDVEACCQGLLEPREGDLA